MEKDIIEKEKGLVIAGFPGIGKSVLGSKYLNVKDLESSDFYYDNTGFEDIPVEARKGMERPINKDWPLNYVNAIKEAQKKYDIIFVWIDADKALPVYNQNNIPYTVCYPSKEALDEEYIKERIIGRGNSEKFAGRVRKVADDYESRVKRYNENAQGNIILKKDETLESYLLENNYTLLPKFFKTKTGTKKKEK